MTEKVEARTEQGTSPTPWRVVEPMKPMSTDVMAWEVADGNGDPVASHMTRADAHLVSATPDLAKELALLYRYCQLREQVVTGQTPCFPWVEAALAKAGGGAR